MHGKASLPVFGGRLSDCSSAGASCGVVSTPSTPPIFKTTLYKEGQIQLDVDDRSMGRYNTLRHNAESAPLSQWLQNLQKHNRGDDGTPGPVYALHVQPLN